MPDIDFSSDKGKASLLDELLSKDAEIRDGTLRSLSKLHPDAVMPEMQAEKKIQAVRDSVKAEVMKEIEDREKQQAMKREVEGEKAALSQQGHSADDIAAIEKLMTERRIGSYTTAAEYYRLSKAPSRPTQASLEDRAPLIPDRKEKELLWKNPTEYARKLARQGLEELRVAKQQ